MSGVSLAITLATSPATATVTDISNNPINYIVTFTPGVAQPQLQMPSLLPSMRAIKLPTLLTLGF